MPEAWCTRKPCSFTVGRLKEQGNSSVIVEEFGQFAPFDGREFLEFRELGEPVVNSARAVRLVFQCLGVLSGQPDCC